MFFSNRLTIEGLGKSIFNFKYEIPKKYISNVINVI